MAKPGVTKHYNNFINGEVSDGNEFSAPENAVRRMVNMEILEDNSVRRRRGLSYDKSPPTWENFILNTWEHTQVVDFNNAGGALDRDYALVINGPSAKAYRKDQPGELSDNQVAEFLLNTGSTLTTDKGYSDQAVNAGYMISTHKSFFPQLVTNTSATAFSVQNFQPLVRDLQGVDDGYDVEHKPTVSTITISGTATTPAGDIITGATSGYKARALETMTGSGAGTFDIMFIGPHGFTLGENYTSPGGGAGTVTSITTNDGLSNEHFYNLINQGWVYKHIYEYAVATGTYPNNAQIWFAGKNASGDFDPATLDKIGFGGSPAPKGREIIDATHPWRRFTDPINGVNTTVSVSLSAGGFSSCEFFAGRLVLAGGYNSSWRNRVMIGQLLTSESTDTSASDFQLAKFYSINDLTAEERNETLPTDGTTFPVAGADSINKVVALGKGLVILADNGVWFLRGTDIGFSPQDFEVVKVSGTGCRNPASVTVAGDSVAFWGDDGVYTATVDETGLSVRVSNLSYRRVDTSFKNLTKQEKLSAAGYYHKQDKRIIWLFNSGQVWSDAAQQWFYNRQKAKVLNVLTGAFADWDMTAASGGTSTNSPQLAGFTQSAQDGNEKPTDIQVAVLKGTFPKQCSWMRFSNREFLDWDNLSSTYYPSYVEPWAEHLGEPHLKKQISAAFFYFKRTETQFVDNGSGGVEFNYPSGALFQSRWDWTDLDTGQWSQQRQVYRFPRPYTPGPIGSDFDYGYTVIVSKEDVPGQGMSVTVRLDAEDGKDMHLLGYTLVYKANAQG